MLVERRFGRAWENWGMFYSGDLSCDDPSWSLFATPQTNMALEDSGLVEDDSCKASIFR